MNNPLISIIVPVYNTLEFLPKCVESILSQTYTNWEAIFIDDGSNDGSYEYLTKQSSPKFKILCNNSGKHGPGAARNVGLNFVKGEYLCFLDSDDYFDSNHLKYLVTEAENKNTDIVQCDFVMVSDGNYAECVSPPTTTNTMDIVADILERRVPAFSVLRLFKSSLISDNSIRFPPNNWNEDLHFCIQAIMVANSYSYISCSTYYYVQRTNSISNTMTREVLFKKLSNSIENISDLYNYYGLKNDKNLSKIALNYCNKKKRDLVRAFPNDKRTKSILRECLPKSYKIQSAKSLGDIAFWIASHWGITIHYNILFVKNY